MIMKQYQEPQTEIIHLACESFCLVASDRTQEFEANHEGFIMEIE